MRLHLYFQLAGLSWQEENQLNLPAFFFFIVASSASFPVPLWIPIIFSSRGWGCRGEPVVPASLLFYFIVAPSASFPVPLWIPSIFSSRGWGCRWEPVEPAGPFWLCDLRQRRRIHRGFLQPCPRHRKCKQKIEKFKWIKRLTKGLKPQGYSLKSTETFQNAGS